jgi:signal transduction histidine kinase
MARSSATAGIDLRRLYKRFFLFVMLPTTCLVGFGVLAVRNERVVVEQRFAEQYNARLRVLVQYLATLLETTAEGVAKGTSLPNGALVRYQFTYQSEKLTTSSPIDPKLHDALAFSLEALKPSADGRVILLPIVYGPARGLYALRLRSDGAKVGMAFSEPEMSAALAKEATFLFPWDPARFRMEGPREASHPIVRPLRTMLNDLTAESIETGVISMQLPGVLGDWRVVAELSGNDPAREALWRNQLIYILTLVFCAVFITIGAFTTLRGIWLQARLSKLRTDFVSNISHEIRTPLTSIRMFAETLRSGRALTPEERATCVEFIARESERLSALAERTLSWARIEAGRQQFVFKPTPAGALVQNVVGTFLMRETVPRECVQVEVDAGAGNVNADETALSQVLLNLLENAVKYSGSEKRIAVRVRRAGSSVFIDVEDNGIGIGHREQRKVFERFYRSDDLLARQTEGTGLGLSIARRIVEAHHGRLTLKSDVGRGSVFTVSLPAIVSASNTAPAKEHVA